MDERDFYWRAANTLNFANAEDPARPLSCYPTGRDGGVCLCLRQLDHPDKEHEAHRRLNDCQARLIAERLRARHSTYAKAEDAAPIGVSFGHGWAAVRFMGVAGGNPGHIHLSPTEADALADWLTRMADKRYTEVAR